MSEVTSVLVEFTWIAACICLTAAKFYALGRKHEKRNRENAEEGE